MNKYNENLKKAIADREEKKESLRSSVLSVVRTACKEAVREFPSLKKVALVGSIVCGAFSEHSDIDIVVTGLSKTDYFRLIGFLENKIGRSIDLIMDEDLSVKDKTHIFRNKEVVYGSKEH